MKEAIKKIGGVFQEDGNASSIRLNSNLVVATWCIGYLFATWQNKYPPDPNMADVALLSLGFGPKVIQKFAEMRGK